MTAYSDMSALLGLSVGVFSLIMNNGHLLNSLLSLEFLALMVYWLLSLSVSGLSAFFFVLFYLVMAVCESVLGLSLMISGAYSHGSDYMKTYSSLNC